MKSKLRKVVDLIVVRSCMGKSKLAEEEEKGKGGGKEKRKFKMNVGGRVREGEV